MKDRIKAYVLSIYKLRYFLKHLVALDLKNKFRRSKLGLLWTFISPLCITLIMSVIFSAVFKNDIVTYTPYILSGTLFWDLFAGCFQGGSYAIVSNQFYLRQCNHPYSLYTLKTALGYVVTFLIAMISLLLWLAFINPMGILIGIVHLPITLLFYFAIAWSGTTIASYTYAKYRDYPMMATLILQAMWYVSPVFLQESVFKGNDALFTWFSYNPITHLLNLIRMPFLNNRIPTGLDYLESLGFTLLLALLAYRISKKNGKELIFYL